MAILYHSMMAIMSILTILAIIARLNMVLNMVIIVVYGKIRKMLATHENGIEKIATVQKIWPDQNRHKNFGHFPLYFSPDFQLACGTP